MLSVVLSADSFPEYLNMSLSDFLVTTMCRPENSEDRP